MGLNISCLSVCCDHSKIMPQLLTCSHCRTTNQQIQSDSTLLYFFATKLCRQIVGFTTKSTFSTLVCIGWRKIIHQDANIPNGFSMTLHSLDKQYLKIICFSVNLCPGIGIITMVAVKIPHHLPRKSFEESFNNKNCL